MEGHGEDIKKQKQFMDTVCVCACALSTRALGTLFFKACAMAHPKFNNLSIQIWTLIIAALGRIYIRMYVC